MILKEVQMYIYRGYEKDKYKGFNFQTQCITTLYENFLPKLHTDNVRKININCGGQDNDIKVTEHIDGFLEIHIPFNFKLFFTLDDMEKKILLLETLQQAVLWVADKMNWEENIFRETYEKVRSADYECKYIWKKPKSNKSRQHKAVVEIEVTLYETKLYLSIINKKGELIKQQIVVEEKPNSYLLEMYLGKLVWHSNEEVRLFRKYTRNPESNYAVLSI